MKTRKHKKKHNKTLKNPNTVWGKNKPLEIFWRNLTSKYVVVIYKDGKHRYINIPNRGTKKWDNFYNNFDNDTNVEAVLSSALSQDAYELGLYPKAKDKSVVFVIKNYKKYFKPIHDPFMRKVWSL